MRSLPKRLSERYTRRAQWAGFGQGTFFRTGNTSARWFMVMALLVLLGACAALGTLAGSESLWLDELTSYWFSSAATPAQVLARMLRRGDPHPPGYQLLLYLWLALPGASDSALLLRLSSVLSFAATACTFGWLLWRVARDPLAVSAFLVSYSCCASSLYYGAELRSYAYLQACLGVHLLARDLVRRAPRPGLPRAVLEGLAFAGAFMLALSHYVGALLVGCLSLVELWSMRRAFREAKCAARVTMVLRVAAWLSGPVSAAVWLSVAAPHGGFRRTLEEPSIRRLIGYFVTALGALQAASLLAALVVAALLGGAWGRGRAWRSMASPGACLPLIRLGLPSVVLMVLLLIAVSWFKPILQARNVLLTIPPILAALALGLAALVRDARTARYALVLPLLGLPLSGFLDVHGQLRDPTRKGEDFWLMARRAQPGAITMNDDMAQKIADAGRISLSQRATVRVTGLRYLKANLGGTALAPATPGAAVLLLLCPHCTARAERKLLAYARKAGRVCAATNAPPRDRVYHCFKAARSERARRTR